MGKRNSTKAAERENGEHTMIKAVFFDIDGTLLSFTARQTPESTRAALAALRENGIKVFIATGRPPFHLKGLWGVLPTEWDGMVTTNGQYCYDDAGVYRAQPLPRAGVAGLVAYLKGEGRDISVAFTELDNSYLNQITPATEELAKTLRGLEGGLALGKPEDAVDKDIYQLNLYIDAAREKLVLPHMPGCRAVRWCDSFDDIIPADGGKAVGLAATLARHGLSREECMAFGDGGNDMEMLEYAGIGVAMGNALDEVKAVADYVTTDVDHDGIANALRHFELI